MASNVDLVLLVSQGMALREVAGSSPVVVPPSPASLECHAAILPQASGVASVLRVSLGMESPAQISMR